MTKKYLVNSYQNPPVQPFLILCSNTAHYNSTSNHTSGTTHIHCKSHPHSLLYSHQSMQTLPDTHVHVPLPSLCGKSSPAPDLTDVRSVGHSQTWWPHERCAPLPCTGLGTKESMSVILYNKCI